MLTIIRKYSHVNWAIADQSMVSGVNFLTGIILARYLGLTEYGIFTLAWMAVLFVNSFQFAMVSSPMMSLGPKQNANDAPAYFGAVLLQQIVFVCLSFVLLFLSVKISGLIFPQWDVQGLALPLASAAFAFQMQDFMRRYFFTRQRPLAAFINDAISYLGQFGILVWLFYTTTMDAEQAIWVIAATSLVAVVIGIFFMGCVKWDARVTKTVARHHWKFSKWLTASALMQWGSGHLFVVIAGATLGVAAVGAMRAAQNIVGVAHILFQGLENIVPIRSANYFQNGGKKKLIHYLRKVTIFSTTATACLCGLIVIMPEFWLGFIYGDEYVSYSYLLYWYSGIYLIISLGLPLRAGLRAIEVTRPIFFSNLWASIFTVLFAYPLAVYYNLTGVMAGTLIIQVCMIVVLATSFKKCIRTSI